MELLKTFLLAISRMYQISVALFEQISGMKKFYLSKMKRGVKKIAFSFPCCPINGERWSKKTRIGRKCSRNKCPEKHILDLQK